MKIYVASSWRNAAQQDVVRELREHGHEVYDFRNPPGCIGFSWRQLGLGGNPNIWPVTLWRDALAHPITRVAFHRDMTALRECDVCVLVLPAGRDAHLEAGWACGARKFTIVYAASETDKAGMMVKMCDVFAVSLSEVHVALERSA